MTRVSLQGTSTNKAGAGRSRRSGKARKRPKRRGVQLHLDHLRHGGRREGAGRPKSSSKVVHDTRPGLPSYVPVHVTVRIDRRLRLRSQRLYPAIVGSIARAQGRFGLRILHWSVQHGHIHMLVEAANRRSLSRGMQGLSIRTSRAINRAMGRARGRVFVDRYHARQLRNPRQFRAAMAYVLNNRRRHLRKAGKPQPSPMWVDAYASGSVKGRAYEPTGPPPCAKPRTWLASNGWKRYGLVRINEIPG